MVGIKRALVITLYNEPAGRIVRAPGCSFERLSSHSAESHIYDCRQVKKTSVRDFVAFEHFYKLLDLSSPVAKRVKR